MLNAKAITDIQAVLGIENLADLIAAEEENEVVVPQLFTTAQNETTRSNAFKEGKSAFGQIWTKEMKTKYPSITYDGKNPETFMERFAEGKVSEIEVDPDKKVQKLKTDNEELKMKLQTSLDSVDGIKSEHAAEMFGIRSSGRIMSAIPDGTIIPRSDVLVVFNSRVKTSKDDDGNIFHAPIGGEPYKNEVGDYLNTQEVVNKFIDDNKYLDGGGMGEGDKHGGTKTVYKNMSSYSSAMEKKGINQMSLEGQAILIESKKQKDFDING